MDAAPIDYKVAGFWFSVGQWAFNVIVAFYLFTSRKHAATNSRVDALAVRVEATEKDLIEVRTNLGNMPDQDDITLLRRDMADLIRKIGETKGRLDAINRIFDIMNQGMMKGK